MPGKPKGWSAAGRLQPLWTSYPGKRDGLAEAVGTTGNVLSSVNTGKRTLGYDLGRRLAGALDVTLFDLGAPADVPVTVLERRVVDRLAAVEEELAALAPWLRVVQLLAEGRIQEARRALPDMTNHFPG